MEKLQKIFLAIGIILLALVPIWAYLIVPELEKLPDDFSSFVDLTGTDTLYNLKEGKFYEPSSDVLIRKVSVDEVRGEKLKLIDFFSASHFSGEIVYEKSQTHVVDRKTKLIEGTEAYFEFPRNLEKKDYTTWFYYLSRPFTAKFEREEDVLGLRAYMFIFDEIYDATDGYDDEGIDPLIPEQYNAIEHARGIIWVEPITGIIVKWEDSGIAHYVEKTADPVSSEVIAPILRWDEGYREDSVANQVRIAQSKKQQTILYEIIIPVLSVIIAIALLIVSYVGGLKKTNKMEKLQKIFLIIGIILLIFIPIWYFFIVSELEKMPVDYQYRVTYSGQKKFFDLETNEYKETISRTEREDKVNEVRGDTLVIEDKLVSYDLATNVVDFRASGMYGVNRITRKNVAGFGEAETGYFKFPLHVQKREYIMHSPEIQEAPTPVVFEKIELIKGLKTYKFNYFVEPSDKTRFFPLIKGNGYLVEGEEGGSLWVEPKSGHIVDLNKKIANDLLNQSTHDKIAILQELFLEFTDDTIINQVQIAQNKKQQIILYEIIIPILLALIAAALLLTSYVGRERKQQKR